MNLTEEYIGKVLPFLESDASIFGGVVITKKKNGKDGHYFPCPKCSALQKQDFKKRARTACIIAKQQCNEVYDYHCRRCPEDTSFENFLCSYKPALGKTYKLKKENY